MHIPDLPAFVLDAARKAGADAADTFLVERDSLSLRWRLGAMEDLERKESVELGIRVMIGRQVATAETNRLEPDLLRELIEATVAAARLLPEDKWAGLADPTELARQLPDLDLADPAEPSIEQLCEAAAAAEDAARAVPGVTNSDGAGATWARSKVTLAASNGFSGSYGRTRHALWATVLAGAGTAMQRDYESRTTTYRADLPDPSTIGRTAGERAVRRQGPRKVTTTRVPVVYEPRVAAGLLRHLTSAISGEAVASGRSFLKDRLGEAICAPGVTIIDDPLRPRGLASRPFDGEGIAATRQALVENGVLTTWLLDLGTARRLGLASTGHASRGGAALGGPSPTNLTLEPGPLSQAGLIADIEAGFLVTELMGMGVSTVTGDYSRGAAGFWIERGQIAYPVSEVTVAGNLRDMLARMVPGADLEIQGSVDAPSVRIDELTVAGT